MSEPESPKSGAQGEPGPEPAAAAETSSIAPSAATASEHGSAPEPNHTPPPSARAPDGPEVIERRRFLARVSVGLGAAGGVALTAPLVGFVLAPLAGKIPRTFHTVGKVSDFKIGDTVNVSFLDPSPLPWAGVTAKTGAWLRRESATTFRAFAINCAHLGCPVRWLPDARLFMCPCHGGVYYEDGSVAAGPPPHALDQYLVRVEGDLVQIRAQPIPIG